MRPAERHGGRHDDGGRLFRPSTTELVLRFRAESMSDDWVTVARVEELAPGAWRVVTVDDAQVALFNLDGAYYAIEDVCTHDGGQLTGGTVEGDEIVCPRHGARFCIRTGEALSAPAYEATAAFPVRIDNGWVQVRDSRWD